MKTIAKIIHHKNMVLKILDDNDDMIYCELDFKYWAKAKYDSNHDRTYYENSTGYIQDNRP